MIPPPQERNPVWGYEDLGLFLGAALPSLAIAGGTLRLLKRVAPSLFDAEAFSVFVFQCLVYVLLSGALKLLLKFKYDTPFWKSLGWNFRFRAPGLYAMSGPFLAVAISSLAVLLRAPVTESPIEELIVDRRTLILVVLLGPIFEELVFRGFLFPLLARSMGAWAAIFATAVPFALLHGAQIQWTWQLLVPIGMAGVVFGWVRYKTGSTAASTLVHIGYNSTAVIVYFTHKL